MSSEEIALYLRFIANTLVVYWLVRMVRLHYTGYLFYKERYWDIPKDHAQRLATILTDKPTNGNAGGPLFFIGVILLFIGPLYMPGLPVAQKFLYYAVIFSGIATEFCYDFVFIKTAYAIKRKALNL